MQLRELGFVPNKRFIHKHLSNSIYSDQPKHLVLPSGIFDPPLFGVQPYLSLSFNVFSPAQLLFLYRCVLLCDWYGFN